MHLFPYFTPSGTGTKGERGGKKGKGGEEEKIPSTLLISVPSSS